jgi:hypothetical protein
MALQVQDLLMQRRNDSYKSPNGHASPSNGNASAQALMQRPNYGNESQSSHTNSSNGGASAGGGVMGFDVINRR